MEEKNGNEKFYYVTEEVKFKFDGNKSLRYDLWFDIANTTESYLDAKHMYRNMMCTLASYIREGKMSNSLAGIYSMLIASKCPLYQRYHTEMDIYENYDNVLDLDCRKDKSSKEEEDVELMAYEHNFSGLLYGMKLIMTLSFPKKGMPYKEANQLFDWRDKTISAIYRYNESVVDSLKK